MPSNLRLLAILAVVGLVGCQHGGGNELVERELRLQEDRIYELQDYIKEYQAKLESCRREIEALRRELGTDDDAARPPAPLAPTTSAPSRPRLRLREDREPETSVEPPLIEPGIEIESGIQFEPETPPGGQIRIEPGIESETLPEDDLLLEPPGEPQSGGNSSHPVESLVLNPLLTGGLDTDGHAGDEGVLVVVEPRDARGEPVKAGGEVSLMVVDPEKTGPEARIARWDFDSDEALALWRKSLLGNGMHFELAWPGNPPESDRLHLYVRLITPDGRKLITDKEINVDPLQPVTGKAAWPKKREISTQSMPRKWSPSERALARRSTAKAANQPAADASPAASEPPKATVNSTNPNPSPKQATRPIWQPFR